MMGKVPGNVDTFLRKARSIFGELASVHAERVRGVSPEQPDALITAVAIDAVVGVRTRH